MTGKMATDTKEQEQGNVTGAQQRQIASGLRAAKALIKNPENWWDGNASADDRECAMTAPGAVMDPYSATVACAALNRAAVELFRKSAIGVNNDLGHAAVMQMYDYAIVRAEGELR